ncbi:MAG: glycosyltransferase [Defluviitaleaceae bacterium]|nr:glycosyltransferase [Defluviitaleaceae bacterium]
MGLELLININFIFFIVVTILFSYRIAYIIMRFAKNTENEENSKEHTYAVIIAARNEEVVIGDLIKNIKEQKYPQEKIKIFVVADNCIDDTAKIAKNLGAIVYERYNKTKVGKGYALDYLFKCIYNDYGNEVCDAFLIFDADNLLDENYIKEINRTFSAGNEIITSYRNSKNYDSNFISAGQSLFFLKESQYTNRSRMRLGTGSPISGTGFLVSSKIIKEQKGWQFHTLVEDIEFSIYHAIQGNKIAYCENAIFYDEQPTTFEQSYNQRLRWSKGFYQVFFKYGFSLFKTIFSKRSFYAYDMLMKIVPFGFLTTILIAFNLIVFFAYAYYEYYNLFPIHIIFGGIQRAYILLLIIGFLTIITEWKKIHTNNTNKILYLFTYPLFMFTFLPISLIAAFSKVEWKPIIHKESKSLSTIKGGRN